MMNFFVNLLQIFVLLFGLCSFTWGYVPIKINIPGLILHVNLTIENVTSNSTKNLSNISGVKNETESTSDLRDKLNKKNEDPSIEQRMYESTTTDEASTETSSIISSTEAQHEIQKIIEWKNVGLYSMQKGHTIDYLHSSQWGTKHLACRGHRQSPIDVNPGYTMRFTERIWKFFDEMPKEMMIINNGNTIQIIGNWKNKPYLQGPGILPYKGKYVFSDITFHWSRRGNGSEHKIAGKRFLIEAQLLFYKDKGNKDIMEAARNDDHIAIISVLFSLSDSDGDCLKEVLHGVKDVILPRTMKKIQPFPLIKLLPTKTTYYMYSGSITVPPCTETATWMIMDSNLQISESQVKILREIIGNDNQTIITNSRVINGKMYGHL